MKAKNAKPSKSNFQQHSYIKFKESSPIFYEDQELGTLTIQFCPNNEKNDDTDLFDFYRIINSELDSYIHSYANSDIELAIKQFEILKNEPRMSFMIFVSQYLSDDKLSKLHSFFNLSDEQAKIFIATEGPLSLRISNLQEKLFEWVADPDHAGVKIHKLKKALIEYAQSTKESPDLEGRSPSYFKEKLGIDWVTDAYADLRDILRAVKQNVEARVLKDFGPITKREAKKHVTKYKKEFGHITDDEFRKHLERKLEEIKSDEPSLKGLLIRNAVTCLSEESSSPGPLTEFINNDNILRNTFNSFTWAPYMLAKMIIATFLDISIETVKDYLQTT